ncbi:MAG TPA: UDP-glucose--hexose-1-phosphate uridylyltransferase [Candidatus Marinimicrobia bacterium]|nr:UDP-glucose--hexose-1-phosphate uridylyltransferase [Candidatus Neomarinimicrobiota bacterium]HRS51119.1 UDP-glucose--hexose-1-phosphate uridylyltransferase [Candidatus Neomarinimicrobiota bacterium]HRU92802.1 UDP-glucose--hexose-1-phosphate uridylyltransferase [Candidatus Neomarinimicrobiota bacterium]
MSFDFSQIPHRRFNPLTGEWILVSPHRTERPWHGGQEPVASEERPKYDPECYLCPGNRRASGAVNPSYTSTYVFTNDFPALFPDTPDRRRNSNKFIRSAIISGTCRVICFSPRHDLTLAEMAVEEIRNVITVWAEQTMELGEKFSWVQIFENKGAMMGCSNPHPHGQVWAVNSLPNEPYKENRRQSAYFKQNKSVLLTDYLLYELESRERVVLENENWLAVMPFWAIWPFEILLLPRRHILRLPDLAPAERNSLASILKSLLVKYDNLFQSSFPYTMGWHGAPTMAGDFDHWQLHAHFYPPLLRSSSVKKFLVGYEMLAEAQRDLTPEVAARTLRETSEIHYKSLIKNK